MPSVERGGYRGFDLFRPSAVSARNDMAMLVRHDDIERVARPHFLPADDEGMSTTCPAWIASSRLSAVRSGVLGA